jgi:translation initiation factor 2B subunit (eIF-2B alpha/beta/delta family)
MCRRVLHIIREEAERDPCGTDRAGSSDPGDTSLDPDYSNMKRFKSEVIESVGELIDELESTAQVINQQALEHVSPGSVVFTAGGETCVENFLREANRKRSFQVIVSESEPGGPGHALARVLADKGVDVTLIAESATFAVMPRVHLVVLSARGVFADGAALCPAGHNAVAVAAKAHRVPVIVLAGTHELSPLGPDDPEYDTDELLNPAEAYAYEKMGASAAAGTPAFSIANPAFDRVAPDLISLFVTDAGGQVPGFVASLLAEFYSPEDRRFEG